ncbi:hypothetical protein PoB_002371200 [Plakobranchus ocellatus]|uniref:Uncharacterized protein n=1 Tax=Plakobranchus ocellatus TaxID=259542 RepID=A0AAV3ZRQ6_9GAST|nr:hypothetical protein PoB_002371200 [Plakobranchus ocellatus]
MDKVSPCTPYAATPLPPRTYTVTAQRDSNREGNRVFTVCVVPGGSLLATITGDSPATTCPKRNGPPNIPPTTTLADVHGEPASSDVNCKDSKQGTNKINEGAEIASPSGLFHVHNPNFLPADLEACGHKGGDCEPKKAPTSAGHVWVTPSGATPSRLTDHTDSSYKSRGYDWAAPTIEKRPVVDRHSTEMSTLSDDGFEERTKGQLESDSIDAKASR